MASLYAWLRARRFSKTARSRPGHREARWDGGHTRSIAVLRGRLPDDVPERAAERAQAAEADLEADVGDAPAGLAQQEHRALDPTALQIAMRRLAERGAEDADEVRLGHTRDRCQGGDVERVGKRPIHGVAGAQEPPIRVLDRAVHHRGRIVASARG